MDSILRVTDLSQLKLTSDGALENAEELKKTIGSDWSGFITSTGTRGSEVDNPPAGSNPDNGGNTGRAAQLAARYVENQYGKVKEN